MVVAMMQPTFLPWAGYFALMDACDCFVLLDDFEFSRQSFQQRNRLFVSGSQAGWVTVPVEHRSGEERQLLSTVRPLITARLRHKLARLLSQSYGWSPYFDAVIQAVGIAVEKDWPTLADLNVTLVQRIASLLRLSTTVLRSSNLASTGVRSERVADLLGTVGATSYLAAAGAETYMRQDGVFPLPDIDTYFQVYTPAPYEQRQSETFVPYLSVVDMLFQIGPERSLETIRLGANDFAPWDRGALTS
jgi:hypothetical protein